jgi:hypothetical protein
MESFDLRPSSQYILVRAIPTCLHFAKMSLCQVSLLSRCSPGYLTSPLEGVARCLYGPEGINYIWVAVCIENSVHGSEL